MDLGIAGKTALVLGGGGGLGSSTAASPQTLSCRDVSRQAASVSSTSRRPGARNDLSKRSPPKARRRSRAVAYGRPEEYANTVAVLASAHASYIIGSIVRVDGSDIPSI